jgi:Fungal specific transcription factor domain
MSLTMYAFRCAIGAAFSDRVVRDLPRPLAEFFALRAKALLDIEMDSPTVVTVQALVLMSTHEAAFARDARGWLYSGMAMRLAVDLGLHLDVGRYILAGLLNQKEAHLRQTAFWGTYIVDRYAE